MKCYTSAPPANCHDGWISIATAMPFPSGAWALRLEAAAALEVDFVADARKLERELKKENPLFTLFLQEERRQRRRSGFCPAADAR
jgi:hypothetical protein